MPRVHPTKFFFANRQAAGEKDGKGLVHHERKNSSPRSKARRTVPYGERRPDDQKRNRDYPQRPKKSEFLANEVRDSADGLTAEYSDPRRHRQKIAAHKTARQLQSRHLPYAECQHQR